MENTIVNTIANKITDKYQSNILSIGIFGSRSNNKAKKYSDYDFVVITENIDSRLFFILKRDSTNKINLGEDLKITVFYVSKMKAFQNIADIENIDWSNRVNMLINCKVIRDKNKIFKEIKNYFDSILPNGMDLFKKLAGKWLSLSFEYLCKLNNMPENLSLNIFLKWMFIFCIVNYYKSLNSTYLRSNYDLLEEIFSDKSIPENILGVIQSLLTSESVDVNNLNLLWQEINKTQTADFKKIQIQEISKIL